VLSIFLSHSHADKPFARRLSESLRGHGIGSWLDEAEIRVGDSLIQKIEVAIRDCTYLGVILSPQSVESEWVRREVEIALNDEIHGRRVKVLPLLHRPCQLPGFLVGKFYADFSDNFESGLSRLLARLNEDLSGNANRTARLRESFLNRYQTWAAFDHRPQDLLQQEALAEALEFVSPSSVSVGVLEFLLSSMSYIVHRSTPTKPEWVRWMNAVPNSITIAAFKSIFEASAPCVRAWAATISALLDADTNAIVQDRLLREDDIETKRRLVQSLHRKLGGPLELPDSLIQDGDWIVKMYVTKKKIGSHPALLISDETSFAAQLGEMAGAAGFDVVSTRGSLIAQLGEDICEHDALSCQELVILVRGENFVKVGHSELYERLRKYVVEGGKLFATCWTAWENKNDGGLQSILPFVHVQESYSEDRILQCSPTADDHARLFSAPFLECRSSFELLGSQEGTTVLCEISTGNPFFGHKAAGRGVCYYLNACQHCCSGEMISPLESSQELRESIQRVFGWIARSVGKA
jgi:hypothetical protein